MELYKINVTYVIDGDPDHDPDDYECVEESVVCLCRNREEAIGMGYEFEVEWNLFMLYDSNPVMFSKYYHMMDADTTPKSRLELRKTINTNKSRYYQFEGNVEVIDEEDYYDRNADTTHRYKVIYDILEGY